jgi:hypothetical protein
MLSVQVSDSAPKPSGLPLQISSPDLPPVPATQSVKQTARRLRFRLPPYISDVRGLGSELRFAKANSLTRQVRSMSPAVHDHGAPVNRNAETASCSRQLPPLVRRPLVGFLVASGKPATIRKSSHEQLNRVSRSGLGCPRPSRLAHCSRARNCPLPSRRD